MDKSSRIRPVVKFAERGERQLAEALARCQQQLEQQKAKLQELERYYEDYRGACHRHHSLDLQRLQETRSFMSRLAQAIRLQKDAVAQSRQQLVACRRKWLGARQRSKSLEHLQDRYQAQEQQFQEQQAQKQSDDLVSARFAWRKNSEFHTA